MYLRTAAITALTTSLTFGLVAGAPAASAGSGGGEQITEFSTQTVRATLSLDPKSRKASITDLSAITGLVDQAGKLIGSVTKAPLNLRASAGTGGISEGSCVNNRSAKQFYAYQPQRIGIVDKLGAQHYVVSPYRKDKAREVGTRKKVRSTQFELCTTGGADLQDGFRIYQAGIGMTILSQEGFKIDQRWQSGQTPADYGLSLGFKLANDKVPLEITGTLTQQPRDLLKGSFFGPYQSFMDEYSQNSVNAWWEDGCLSGYSRCVARADGSPDFQGAVAHGLWEFLPGQLTGDLQYHVTPYLRYSCKGLFGCG